MGPSSFVLRENPVYRMLPRINIAGQLTLLVAVVAGLAIYVVSRAAEANGRDLLLSARWGILVEEGQRERLALRDTMRGLSRTVRSYASRIDRSTSIHPREDNAASVETIFEQLLQQQLDTVDADSLTAWVEARLVVLTPSGVPSNELVLQSTPKGASGRFLQPGQRDSAPLTDLLRRVWPPARNDEERPTCLCRCWPRSTRLRGRITCCTLPAPVFRIRRWLARYVWSLSRSISPS